MPEPSLEEHLIAAVREGCEVSFRPWAHGLKTSFDGIVVTISKQVEGERLNTTHVTSYQEVERAILPILPLVFGSMMEDLHREERKMAT